MPLTALLDDILVDASVGDDDLWAKIYRTKPRTQLLCRGCGNGVHAKISSRALRFFCHDRVQSTCPSNGETPEHLLLKSVIAQIIRDFGWTAVVEACPSSDDHGGWRADVMAISPDRERRVAIEAQQSPMTVALGRERTERYLDDGVEVLWVTLKHPGWLFSIPGIHVEATKHDLGPESSITRGLARLDGQWAWTSKDVALRDAVASVLGGGLVVRELHSLKERGAEYDSYHFDALAWVLPRDFESFQTHAQRIEEERLKAETEQRKRAQNINALYARQSALLPAVVSMAEAEATDGEHVWLGVPSTMLGLVGQEVVLDEARGNEKTAMGAVVWLGAARDSLRLFAVISPVASQIGDGLARSWQKRGVHVFAEEDRELQRLSDALGWKATLITPAEAASAKAARETGYAAVEERRKAVVAEAEQAYRSRFAAKADAVVPPAHEDPADSVEAALLLRAAREAMNECQPRERVLIGSLGGGLLDCGATVDAVVCSYVKKSPDLTGTKVFISDGSGDRRLFGLVSPMLGQYAEGARVLLEKGTRIYVDSVSLSEAAEVLGCSPATLRTEVG